MDRSDARMIKGCNSCELCGEVVALALDRAGMARCGAESVPAARKSKMEGFGQILRRLQVRERYPPPPIVVIIRCPGAVASAEQGPVAGLKQATEDS